MKFLVLVVGIVFSTVATAEPSGSLKTMMETPITLIEYIDIKTQLRHLRSGPHIWAAGGKTYRAKFDGRVQFDYDENKLRFFVDAKGLAELSFKTLAEAKAYSQAMIEVESLYIFMLANDFSRPNGWGTKSTNAENFRGGVHENIIIENIIPTVLIEELRGKESPHYLETEAHWDERGKIVRWSFNL